MLKVKILSVGKTKESWLSEALEEYLKRLKPLMEIEFSLARHDAHLEELAAKEPALICLDSTGKLMDSEEFSAFFYNKIQEGGSRLAFIIGGPEGLPPTLKKRGSLISLSPLTFTHQMVRLILVEQIYRSTEIAKGSNYHK